jgi:hypothetical protein
MKKALKRALDWLRTTTNGMSRGAASSARRDA